jgi:two-component system, OmpR family, sensor kinase
MTQTDKLSWRSVKFGVAKVFALFLTLVLVLGAFSLWQLSAVNRVSLEIRDRWLQSTRVLGDLNNYTSDARAAEAGWILARNRGERIGAYQQIKDLDRQIAQSDRDYRNIAHDAQEWAAYARFVSAWGRYQQQLRLILDAPPGREGRVVGLYMTSSGKAYDAASDALGVLTAQTVRRASQVNERAMATYNGARVLIVLVILIAAVSLLEAIRYIGRYITSPILSLAARMRSLAANDMSVEIQGAERPDEIGEMARAVAVFKHNAVELAQSRRGLVQQASMLEERLEAEQALTSLQRNFVSMASHEFRTPLTIIDGQAQRIIATLPRAGGPDAIAERAGRIRKAVQQMTHTIEHLLEAARLFDGEPTLYFHPMELEGAVLVKEACSFQREISPTAQIEEDVVGDGLRLNGDPRLLRQAIGNLISNAVKYSPDGGRVIVGARRLAEGVEFYVADSGIGIPDADKERIFERYHRGANVSGIVGTGIGLYFAKLVAEMHGGAIKVESREGKGAKFMLCIPSAG